MVRIAACRAVDTGSIPVVPVIRISWGYTWKNSLIFGSKYQLIKRKVGGFLHIK